MTKKLVLGLIALSISHLLLAQEKTSKTSFADHFYIGAGSLFTHDLYEKDNAPGITVSPMILMKQGNWFMRGPKTGYYLFQHDIDETQKIGLATIGLGRLRSLNRHDATHLTSINDRNPTYEIGFEASYVNSNIGWMTLQYTQDILGVHDSGVWRYMHKGLIKSGNFFVLPYFGVEYQHANMMDYYYGVNASEASGKYPQYQAKSATSFLIGWQGKYQLSKHWHLFNLTEFNYFEESVEKSPLINKNESWFTMFGLAYSF